MSATVMELLFTSPSDKARALARRTAPSGAATIEADGKTDSTRMTSSGTAGRSSEASITSSLPRRRMATTAQ